MPYQLSEFAEAYREGEREMKKEYEDALVDWRVLQGDNAELARNAIREWLNTLAYSERQSLEDGFAPSGKRIFNDPDSLQKMLSLAVGAIPANSQELRDEIRLLQYSLRKNRAGWFGSPRKQMRLAALIQAQKTAPRIQAKLGQPSSKFTPTKNVPKNLWTPVEMGGRQTRSVK